MTNPPQQQSIYWDPFFVDGREISLVHLDPFEFACPTPDGNQRRVRVVYKSHVFTRAHAEGDQPYKMCFDKRIFCPDRYADSHNLQTILKGLPTARVFQTWEKRNYVFLAVEMPQRDDRYHLFFEVKKISRKRDKHIELRVESAYRNENSPYAPPNRPNNVRFPILIQSIFMGRPLAFASR